MTTRLVGVVFIGVAVLALPALQPAMASSSGECVTARINAPFLLPNGVLYPAGVVTLCDVKTFSPVRALHRILVDGSSVGLFLSGTRSAEAQATGAPEIVFERDANGNLELIGYSVPSAGRTVAYRLKSRGETWSASASRRSSSGPAAPATPAVAVLATAANVR